MADGQTADQTILVVGGGISGLTAAVEAAEVGHNVLLVEKGPHLGGRVSQHNKYFPKLCSPTCGLEINYQRIKKNPRIRVLTLAEVEEIGGAIGAYSVKIRQNPRFVNEKCTACGDCAEACTTDVSNDYDFGMSNSKAIRIDHEMAFPNRYYMEADFASTDEAKKLVEVCKVNAIEPDMQASISEEKVTSIIWATGWTPYDAEKIQPYGYGRLANVTTNMRFERMASVHGPYKGKIVRPSDGKEAKKVAFIQCAGSRDHNHLAFCSKICCLGSMKHATYVRELYPDSEVTIFYIDLRAMDKYEAFQKRVEADEKVSWIKSKPARIIEDSDGNPVVIGEDTLTGQRYQLSFDMVVLATGMEPNSATSKVPSAGATYDDYGFVLKNGGIIPAGCSATPTDVSGAVQAATASALKAIQAGLNKG